MKVVLEVSNQNRTETYHLHLTKRQVTDRARLLEAILNEFGAFQKITITENDKLVFKI